MPKYPINIYIESKGQIKSAVKELSNEYSACLKMNILSISDVIPAIDDRSFTLVLTENKNTISRLSKHRPNHLFLVYCGDIIDVFKYQKNLDDVIAHSDENLQVKLRLRWIFERIISTLNAEFYQQALLTTIDTVPDMLWLKNNDGVYPMVNETFSRVVDKPKIEIIGKTHGEIWNEKKFSEKESDIKSDASTVRTGVTSITGDSLRSDGSKKKFTTYKSELFDPFGNPYGIVEVCGDIVTFENFSMELSLIIENMPYPMMIFDKSWKAVSMNSRFKDIIGEENAKSFDYPKWKREKLHPLGEPKEDIEVKSVTCEFRFDKGGESAFYEITEVEMSDYFGSITGHLCALMDRTYQRTYENRILKAANTDELTGLYNRRYFYSFLENNMKKTFHLLYLDLDNFKAVNDTYGHDVGDEVLIRIAQLTEKFFPSGVIARIGGDEFAVICEGKSDSELEESVKRLEETVAKEFRVYECGLGISVGMVSSNGGRKGIDMLIHESDVKMYEEKKKHHESSKNN